MIAFGTRLFGKVDAVAGRCHVATLCWHFCYLPLVPLGTYVVYGQRAKAMSGAFTGVRIEFSWKSWLTAWLRLILMLPIVIGLLASFGLTMAALDGTKRIDWSEVRLVGLWWLPIPIAWLATYLLPGLGRASSIRRERLLALYATVAPIDAVSTHSQVH